MRGGDLIDVDVTLVDRPGSARLAASGSNDESEDSTPSTPSFRRLTARAAIAAAVETVTEEELLDGEIVQKIATPEELDGEEVWVVELSTSDQTAIVTVDRGTGDVVEIVVE